MQETGSTYFNTVWNGLSLGTTLASMLSGRSRKNYTRPIERRKFSGSREVENGGYVMVIGILNSSTTQ